MISKNVVFDPINRETITEPVSDEIFHWQGYPVFLKDRILSGVRKDTQYKVHHHKDLIARAFFLDPKELAEFVNNELYDGYPFTCAENIQYISTNGPVFDVHNDVFASYSETQRDIFAYVLGTEPTGYKKIILVGLEIQSEFYEYMNGRVDNYDAQARMRDAMAGRKMIDWQEFQKLEEGEHFRYLYSHNGWVEIVTIVLYLNCRQGNVYPDCDSYIGYDSCEGLHSLNNRQYFSANPLNMPDIHIRQYSMRQRIFYTCMKYNDDGEKFEKIFEEYPEYRMDRELVVMLNSYLNVNIPVPQKGETVIMCEAVRQIREKYATIARNEGIAKGIEKGITKGIAIGDAKRVLEYYKDGTISKERALLDTGLSEAQFDAFAGSGEYPFPQA